MKTAIMVIFMALCLSLAYGNHNLEAQAKAIYINHFPYGVDDNLPEGWRKGKLGEIIELHDSKRIPLSGNERAKMEKIYPYYGAASLMDYVNNYLFDGIFLLLGEDGTVITEDGFPMLQYVWGKFWVNNHAHGAGRRALRRGRGSPRSAYPPPYPSWGPERRGRCTSRACARAGG